MRRFQWLIVMIICAGLCSGCQTNKTRVAEGAVIGGVVGAAAGGIIGHQSHHGNEGAGLGAAIGALTGALMGSQIEKTPTAGQTAAQPSQQQYNPNQMSIQQIGAMASQGVNEDVIVDKIMLSNSKFTLTADDINYLRQQGASQKVIDAMQRQ